MNKYVLTLAALLAGTAGFAVAPSFADNHATTEVVEEAVTTEATEGMEEAKDAVEEAGEMTEDAMDMADDAMDMAKDAMDMADEAVESTEEMTEEATH